jgi:peroxiredoxin Q/BCP
VGNAPDKVFAQIACNPAPAFPDEESRGRISRIFRDIKNARIAMKTYPRTSFALAAAFFLVASWEPAPADEKIDAGAGGASTVSPASVKPAEDGKTVELAVDDAAPAFACRDDQGNTWSSVDYVGKTFVVVYFYPADFTSGCRAQARSFRDNMNQLTADGIAVVGVSGDSIGNHEIFKTVEHLNFTLLADEDGSVARKFGVPLKEGGVVMPRDDEKKPILNEDGNPLVLKRGVTATRWTFIIGLDGKILYKNTKVNPALDSKQVAAFIKDLEKK